MKKALVIVLLIFLLSAACGTMGLNIDPIQLATRAASAQTSVVDLVTESAPMRATSQMVLGTVVAGSATQAPPVLTSIAKMVDRIPVTGGVTLLAEPFEHAVPLPHCRYGMYTCRVNAAHAGVDFEVDPGFVNTFSEKVIAVGPGVVTRIQFMRPGCSADQGDCGMGNTVILEHRLHDGTRLYSLYAHLDAVHASLTPGSCVPAGAPLGTLGASGYGDREFWGGRHLHFEFKSAPVLGDPRSAQNNPGGQPEGQYFGYINDAASPIPDTWGYYNPLDLLGSAQVMDCGQP